MVKRWIRVYAILGFAFVLMARGNRTVEPEGTEKKDVSFISTETEGAEAEETEHEEDTEDVEAEVTEYEENTEGAETESVESDGSILFSEYDSLNDDSLLYAEYLEQPGRDLIREELAVMSEELKGEFTPVVPEDCSFPEELVVTLEEMFYNCASYLERKKDNNYCDKKFKELGSEEFKVEDIDERNKIIELSGVDGMWDSFTVYHFSLTEETDNYLLVSSFTGTCGIADIRVRLMEKVGNELVWLHSFETETKGELIRYDGEFYYITWEENDRLGMYEGFRIHRLNGNPREETLCIRYLPDEYAWSTYSSSGSSADDTPSMIEQKEKRNEVIYEYVKEVEKEFGNDRYLRAEEEDTGEPEIYYGDEKDWESLELDDYGSVGYKVDIANCDLPVYVSKKMDYNGLFTEYVKSRFFYYDPVKNDFKELEKLSRESKQLWFKELEGEMYVCQMYEICDFNYLMEMSLLEKDGENVESNIVYSATVIPKRKFVVTEGPVNVTRLNG